MKPYPKSVKLRCLFEVVGTDPVVKHAIVVPYPKGMSRQELAAFRAGARSAGREMRKLLFP